MQILIVDDCTESRDVIRYFLEEYDFDVIDAIDGEQALEIAEECKPDAIISDIMMDKMDGYEFLREVRRSKSISDTTFIFYSGIYHSSKGAELARSLGADAFISKPQAAETFCSQLQSVLDNKEGRRSLDKTLLESEESFLREYKGVVSSQLKSQLQVVDQAKNKIYQQHVDYKNLFSSIRDVLIVFDLEEKILEANQPALRNVFGFEIAEIVGKKFSDLFYSKEEFESKFKPYVNDPNATLWAVVETLFRRNDGSHFEGELSHYKFNDQGGQSVANIAMVRDVSKRKGVENLITHVFESMGEGMAIVDRDYRIVSANSAYCKMFNVKNDDVIGSHCYSVSHNASKPCNSEGLRCPAVDTFNSGEISIVVHKHECAEGGFSYHENKTFPMKNANGEVYSVIEIFNDVTEKVMLEEQLRHAQKMEAVGTLTGGIAHDFNNILSVIVGHGSLVQMKMDQGHPFENSISNIMIAAEKATNLTQRLLTFSRKQALNFESRDLNEVLLSLEGFLRKLIPASNTLEIFTSNDPLLVQVDQSQFEQVIMNIVINASHAISEHGKITVLTSLHEIDTMFMASKGFGSQGEYAVMTVRDDGVGMNKEVLSRVYEPFFTTKEVDQGTGLGLSVVYGILKQHNGFIDCESIEGEGTTFNVYLPITDVVSIQNESSITDMATGTETILVAEDDENVRFLLKEILVEAGYKVETAKDGLSALKLFTQMREEIDLVILDVIMPNMNGKDTFDEMKKISNDVKVIFISGYTNEIIESKGIVENEYKYLQKPISPSHFLNEIRKSLDE